MNTHFGHDATLTPADEPTLTAFLSIGLNDSEGEPLTDSECGYARRRLDDIASAPLFTLLGTFEGEGVWEGDREPNISALFIAPLWAVVHLRDHTLPILARELRQDSIGFVVHDTDVHPTSYVSAS